MRKWEIQRHNALLNISKTLPASLWQHLHPLQRPNTRDGKWVIETNDDTITLEDAACGYKGLMVIERCFRSMKRTQMKMCPMYHWVPRRIEAHVKLCVLSLLIERVAEIECNDTWSRIQHNLEGLQISEFRINSHKFFRRNEITSNVRNLLNKLKMSTSNFCP